MRDGFESVLLEIGFLLEHHCLNFGSCNPHNRKYRLNQSTPWSDYSAHCCTVGGPSRHLGTGLHRFHRPPWTLTECCPCTCNTNWYWWPQQLLFHLQQWPFDASFADWGCDHHAKLGDARLVNLSTVPDSAFDGMALFQHHLCLLDPELSLREVSQSRFWTGFGRLFDHMRYKGFCWVW